MGEDLSALIARLRAVGLDDHERGCQIRCCACTCGFDDAAVLVADDVADAIESLQAELTASREQAEKLADELRPLIAEVKVMSGWLHTASIVKEMQAAVAKGEAALAEWKAT